MKFVMAIFLLVFSTLAFSNDKVKIYYGAGPQQGLFVPFLEDIDAVGVLKFGNDGENAIQEALITPNSFFITSLTSHALQRAALSKNTDPFNTMKFVAIIGIQPFIIGTSADSQFSTIEELAVDAKQKNKALTLGGTGLSVNTCNLGGRTIEEKYGIKVQYVFYRSPIQSLADAMNGRLDLICRYGSDIVSHVERSRLIQPLVKFTSFGGGPLDKLPVGYSVENYLLLFANNSNSAAVNAKMLKALQNDIYLKKVKSLEESNRMYYFTETDYNKVTAAQAAFNQQIKTLGGK